jgi:hypothetical protein
MVISPLNYPWTMPKTSNQAVMTILEERQTALRVLKDQLIKAQHRMKKFADARRSERKFKVGDWVYLKLQPYMQISVQGRMGTHKLKQKFYGLFKVLEKIGVVVYHLNFPLGSLIHHVFHVSQLKKCRGGLTELVLPVPILSPRGKIRVEPISILDHRVVKKNKSSKMEVLLKWSNLEDEEATLEDLETLCQQFSFLKLEDKLFQMLEALLGKRVKTEKEEERLGDVRIIEFELGGFLMIA